MTTGQQPRFPDEAVRRRAVTDFETNLVVVAGAGTGKTSLLIERALNAIASGRAEIDRLAAITFTEKAAAELRQRLADELEQLRAAARGERACDEGSAAARAHAHLTGESRIPAAEIARRTLAALEKLDQARVLTIHGFCSELLRAHPREAGVDPDFEVDTGEQAQVLCRAWWEEFIGRELGPAAARPEAWARLLSRVPMSRLAEVAQALSGFGVPEELLQPPFHFPAARELFDAVARDLVARIDALRAVARGMAKSGEQFFSGMREALEAFSSEGLESFKRRVAQDPRLERAIHDSGPTPNKLLQGVSADEFKSLVRRCRHAARGLLAADETLTPLIVEVLAPFALSFREELLRRGWVSFDGLLALARNLLRDHADVRRELKDRFRMLLIDEFQDTDPLQYEIVLYLAEREADAEADAYAARLAPGKLFVVGDPKQSIYRFRGADYGAFRRAVRRILDEGGAALDLTANFRSLPGITESINALFEAGGSSSWVDSAYQPAYEPIRAVRVQKDPTPRVELWTVEAPDGTGAERRRDMEGRLVAEAIERLHSEHRCGYGQFSILFRAFASIPSYLRPLRERGIPFVIDGGKDFIKRPEITQSLAVLRALAQPDDPIALVGFLRSPAGAVRDTQLAAYAAAGGLWDWRADVDAGSFPRIADRFRLLRRLQDETRHLPADAVVRRVVEETQLLPLAAAAYEGAQRVANLQKLVAAASQLARDGKLSLEDVVDTLQEGRLALLEWDSPLADDRADAVRITSIHKMKGLENDWVFLPDLARKDWVVQPHRSRVRADAARLDSGQLALALRIGEVADPAALWHELEHEMHDAAEEIRVLYVAMTRAKDRLVLVAGPTREPGRWLRTLASWGYDRHRVPADGAALLDGRVRHRIVKPPPRSRVEAAEGPARVADVVERYEGAVAALRAGAVAPFKSPSLAEEERETARRAIETDSVPHRAAHSRDLAKAAGVAMHRLLETWESADPARARRALRRLCDEIAAEEALDPERLAREAGEILGQFLGSTLVQKLGRIQALGREVPVLLRDELGSAFRGSIDLLYKDERGEVVVADYKTDDDTEPAALHERYGAQLAVYAQAVGRALGLSKPPRAELWLLRSGTVLALDKSSRPPGGSEGTPTQLSLW